MKIRVLAVIAILSLAGCAPMGPPVSPYQRAQGQATFNCSTKFKAASPEFYNCVDKQTNDMLPSATAEYNTEMQRRMMQQQAFQQQQMINQQNYQMQMQQIQNNQMMLQSRRPVNCNSQYLGSGHTSYSCY